MAAFLSHPKCDKNVLFDSLLQWPPGGGSNRY